MKSPPLNNEITRILHESASATPEKLLPLVYEELRKLAACKMANELPGQTLQPTALVHEAWLRVTGGKAQAWDGRGPFFSAAAEAPAPHPDRERPPQKGPPSRSRPGTAR